MIDRVMLDLDGVCVDFIGGAKEVHNRDYPGHPHIPVLQEEMAPWELEPVFEMSPEELWEPMGRQFWASLKPLPHMHELIGLLEAKFSAENICLLTSPVRTDGCIDGKMDWIRENLPKYRRRFLVGPAKEFCAGPTSALIDDSESNVVKFAGAGGKPFLFPAPWNSRFREEPVRALKNWLSTIPS